MKYTPTAYVTTSETLDSTWQVHSLPSGSPLPALTGHGLRLHPLLGDGPLRLYVAVPAEAPKPEGQIGIPEEITRLRDRFHREGPPPLYGKVTSQNSVLNLQFRTEECAAGQIRVRFEALIPVTQVFTLLGQGGRTLLAGDAEERCAPEAFADGQDAYLRALMPPVLKPGSLVAYLRIDRDALSDIAEAALCAPKTMTPTGTIKRSGSVQLSFAVA